MAKKKKKFKSKKQMNKAPKKPFLEQYTPATRRRIKLLLSIFAVVLLFSIFYISQAISNSVDTKKIVEQRKVELKQEEERKSVLEADLKRLENPEYIRQYARGRYQYTANDEIIFILPKGDIDEESTTNNESTTNDESTAQAE